VYKCSSSYILLLSNLGSQRFTHLTQCHARCLFRFTLRFRRPRVHTCNTLTPSPSPSASAISRSSGSPPPSPGVYIPVHRRHASLSPSPSRQSPSEPPSPCKYRRLRCVDSELKYELSCLKSLRVYPVTALLRLSCVEIETVALRRSHFRTLFPCLPPLYVLRTSLIFDSYQPNYLLTCVPLDAYFVPRIYLGVSRPRVTCSLSHGKCWRRG
jgi:hypothetical protein